MSVFNHFAARSEIHRDHWHPRGVRFCQHQSESLRNSVEMQKSKCICEELVLAGDVDRPDIANGGIEIWFNLFAKIFLILNNTGDQQRAATETRYGDRQVNTFVRMDSPQK